MGELELYRILGIDANASLDEIKSAYRVLAKRYHPDSSKIDSHRQFDRVTQAYKLLTVRVKEKRLIDFPVRETGSGSTGGMRSSPESRRRSGSTTAKPSGARSGTRRTGKSAFTDAWKRNREQPKTGKPERTKTEKPKTGKSNTGKSPVNAGRRTSGSDNKNPSKERSTNNPRRPNFDGQTVRESRRFHDGGSRFDDAFEAAAEKMDIFGLGNMLLTSRSPDLRTFAARRLGNSGKKTAYAFLRKALDDHDELVVRSAVEAIGTLRILQSAGELSAVFARSGTPVRMEILKSIRKIGGSASFRPIILAALQDRDPGIRTLGLGLFSTSTGQE